MAARGLFTSRIGFILAAAGSAVGLGNIWGFPTKVAENGGSAFMYGFFACISSINGRIDHRPRKACEYD